MRRLFLVVLFLLSFAGYFFGQNLFNKQWIKFHVERVDGSRYVDRNDLLTTQIRYTFKKNGEVAAWSYLGEQILKYSVEDSILKIEPFQVYKVETLTDSSLILADISNNKLAKDKRNRFYYTTEKKYVNNVINNGLVRFLDDSIIISNSYLAPIFHQDLEKYLYKSLSSELPKELEFSGNFIISPVGVITKVYLKDKEGSMSEFEKKFIKLIYETTFRWNLPDYSKRFYYQIDFSVNVSGSMIGFSFLNQKELTKYSKIGLKEKQEADILFDNGNKLLKRKKYEKAIISYTKCINIDNIYFDAYYNRATAYQKLGRYEDACRDWKYLHDFGQTDGIKLYMGNCGR